MYKKGQKNGTTLGKHCTFTQWRGEKWLSITYGAFESAKIPTKLFKHGKDVENNYKGLDFMKNVNLSLGFMIKAKACKGAG